MFLFVVPFFRNFGNIKTFNCCKGRQDISTMQENRQEKSPIKQKILLFLEYSGVSLYEFYKKSGVTRGILTQSTGISEENIARFLAYAPEVNPSWLLTGKGEMLKSNDIKRDESTEGTVSFVPTVGKPYYDVDFLGGFDDVFNDQTALPMHNIIIQGFERVQLWCNVSGHSMEPQINHGDIIGLRECTVNDIQYGEVYAVVLDSLRTIKKIRKASDPAMLRYIPINTEDFDEQEFAINRIIKVYEVIGSISKFF